MFSEFLEQLESLSVSGPRKGAGGATPLLSGAAVKSALSRHNFTVPCDVCDVCDVCCEVCEVCDAAVSLPKTGSMMSR